MQIYNTFSRRIEEFKPIKKGRVGIYACGPTVYNYAHIGNLRTYIFEDILKRALEYNGYKVKHVMNITDVGHLTSDADTGEDKMEKGARREGKTAWEIAEFYTKAFKDDLKILNILPPDKWAKATDHIKEQINLIKELEKKGYTYVTDDGVYFDTSKLPDYGKLARLKKEDLKAGARVEIGQKKNPTDFALWKFSYPPLSKRGQGELPEARPKRQMEWKSPWGVGFPGWHIECSAMAVKYLDQPFDIHCGGIDHIPVHHTNEIAQSEAAYGKPLANYWMHGEFMLMGENKMAKSSNNFITLQTLKTRNLSPLAFRYFVLQTHYRKQLSFSWEALQAAQNGLEHLYAATASLSPRTPSRAEGDISLLPRGSAEGVAEDNLEQKFLSAINNDLDIPAALALVWQAIHEKTITKKQLLKFDEILGLGLDKIKKEKISIPADVKKLVEERERARKARDWQKSDELRKKIEEVGYGVEDTSSQGPNVIKI